MVQNWLTIDGVIKSGHQVASGLAGDSPYPQGTIEMQLPFFQERGLNLSSFFLGTLNISIAPATFILKHPEYTFKQVQWHPDYLAEDFSFSACQIIFQTKNYNGWIYYPHPETKIGHFQDNSTIEVIAPFIPSLNYGNRVDLLINPDAVIIVN
ncbi:hypothetical protein Sta7437_0974 [Stanieria cyanosphaera PCC 7437]|uniref:Uncharacterized protein n=1 Tax=Stanieria cyanosphaera (strain ATCC 29371 / PCC 7437) TaxID=111780 RepID=K9XR77_STAC7|nr:hypothetical protein [Stanieria cyanosphaera]AFZ34556.1 hypothetical protein Sta7437_0974 [Stanieria cyanosphaera PCC 7437]